MSYVRFPEIIVHDTSSRIDYGFEEIRMQICNQIERVKANCNNKNQKTSNVIVVVACYPGVNQEELLNGLLPLNFDQIYHSDDFAFLPEEIDAILEPDMTDDPVFGIMTNHHLKDFFCQLPLA